MHIDDKAKKLGEFAKKQRTNKGWTLLKATEETGLNPTYISQFERGKVNCRFSFVQRLFKAYKITLGFNMPGLVDELKQLESLCKFTLDADVHYTSALNIINGSDPTIKTVIKIVHALDEELIRGVV